MVVNIAQHVYALYEKKKKKFACKWKKKVIQRNYNFQNNSRSIEIHDMIFFYHKTIYVKEILKINIYITENQDFTI
jgi:predicted RNA-binding protein with PUA-like domain